MDKRIVIDHRSPRITAAPIVAVWVGDLWFPQPLADGDVLDLSRVTALGTWAYAWLRARPHLGAYGANPVLKQQLQRAGIPLAWVDPPAGVSVAERAALFGEEPPHHVGPR